MIDIIGHADELINLVGYQDEAVKHCLPSPAQAIA